MTTCRHFDVEGLARAERGLPDPHVDDCADCQAARADYDKLRAAIAASGADVAPPAGWEGRVLAAIDRDRARVERVHRGWWLLGGVVAAAAVALLMWKVAGPPASSRQQVARFEVIHAGQVVRGDNVAVGDGIRMTTGGDRAAIWIYRDDRLVLACSRVESPNSTGNPDGTCTVKAGSVMAELDGLRVGAYRVMWLQTELRAPASFDEASALLHNGRIGFSARGFLVE